MIIVPYYLKSPKFIMNDAENAQFLLMISRI